MTRKRLEGNLAVGKDDAVLPGDNVFVMGFTKLGHKLAMLLRFKERNEENEGVYEIESIDADGGGLYEKGDEIYVPQDQYRS